MEEENILFPTRKSWWYIPRSHLDFYSKKGQLGAGHYVAENPEYGAVFTYYLKEDIKTLKEIRQEKEKKLDEKILYFEDKMIKFSGVVKYSNSKFASSNL